MLPPVHDRPISANVAEVAVLALLTGCAALMAAAYALDLAGLPMSPWLLAAVLVLAGALVVAGFWRTINVRVDATAAIFASVVIIAAAYLLYLASPSLLPVTIGPDVVHHLQLIHLIQRTHRLVHDAALSPYLLEMMNYTPGAHILAATIAEWTRLDAVRVVQPIAAVMVAVKVGLVYLLALRAGEGLPGRDLSGRTTRVTALAAPLLAFVPVVYTLGSNFHFFFFAQVVSETFALGMVLAAAGWTRTHERLFAIVFAACGAGVFLAWPVYLGPAVGTFAVLVLFGSITWRERVIALTIALIPIAIVAGIHTVLHAEGGRILASSGAVTEPSLQAFGVGFVVCAIAGVLLSISVRTAVSSVLFLAFTLMQAGALAVLAVRAGSHSFYMPFKMMYLAVFPAAVLGAVALIWLVDALVARVPRAHSLAVALPLVIAALLLVGRLPVRPQVSPINTSALAAGEWVRANAPAACVDYFTRHWLTGYWLHLDVLGNARLTDRMRAETFEFPDSVGKWIEGRGLRYGVVERFDDLPRELRSDVTVLARFDPFVVIENLHPAACPAP